VDPSQQDAPTQPARGRSELSGSAAALIVLLFAFGGVGWWLYLRPAVEVDPHRIEAVSMRLGEWQGVDIPLSQGIEAMLQADAQLQRRYVSASGEVVWLYVGYYGTARGGRPEHTPWACYPSAGWRIASSVERPLVAHAEPVDGAELMEFVVEQSGEARLVHFWYATHRSVGIATEAKLTLDHLAGRIWGGGRADGALVRISTPIGPDGIEAARLRLERISGPLLHEVASNWPQAA